ncbi:MULTISPECIES: amidohydrolase [Brevibacterium]|uniref:Amidohydrolase n=1 Tax=Brevibacterium casei TaxID=33889 RepID=A0A7T3ZXN1_9MICO|nr:amidohydrolase [Brevibacterium casei]QQB13516.1 amidohydrolase [Brevibacterium casei]
MTPTADVVFHNGAVFTGSGAPLRDRAVVVTDGVIRDIIPNARMAAYVGESTIVVDLEGGLLSPGFQDAHIHPVQGGVEMLQCDLTDTRSAAEAIDRIASYADAHPDEPWIVGGGWSMGHFPGGAPSALLIDDVIADRPVALNSRDHHSLWVNSAALSLAGIGPDSPDPADGVIERLPNGAPTGTLHEGALRLVEAHLPAVSAEKLTAGLLAAQTRLIALGITGWQDALIGDYAGFPDTRVAYERAIADGTLRVRVRGAQWWQRDRGLEQLDNLIRGRADAAALGRADRYSLGTVKIMVDGIAENFTAAMREPYRDACGRDTHNRGKSFISSERLAEYAIALDRAGFQIHFHALGDRAVHDALNALAAARTVNGPTDLRHHLAHLQVVAPGDVSRFAGLGAVANIQALWACHGDQIDKLTLPYMPESAQKRQYPFGDLVRSETPLAAGSDWPVSSADPIAAAHVAVNRAVPGSDRPPLGGDEQRLELADFFAACTSGAARVNHWESRTGTIRRGYDADLITISPNPFDVAEASIDESRVTSTWIRGERVYSTA